MERIFRRTVNDHFWNDRKSLVSIEVHDKVSAREEGGMLIKTLPGMSLLLISIMSEAHPGGLNSEGCHNDRKNGGYHCHRSSSVRPQNVNRPYNALASPTKARSFRNCSEARAAGAAPVRVGDAGYGRHLDRDGDGVACER